MRERFEELDSLRGLAAISVILCHLLPIAGSSLFNRLNATPLHLFWAGHEAVILFFMLSGFVLSLPYFNNKALKYKDYIIRRVCRIYLPYAVSVTVAIICMMMFYRFDIHELGWWFDTSVHPISFDMIINHILLVGEFQSSTFNMVIWSLVHEMRISIIFPVIVYFLMKYSWKHNVFIAMSCSVMFYVLYIFCLKIFKYDATILQGSYLVTLHYIAFFILGALLAQHKQYAKMLYAKLNSVSKISLLITGVLAYTYKWWFLSKMSLLHIMILDDWAIAVGSSFFILFCLNSNTIKSIVTLKPVHFAGKISYSLYLYHLIVALSLVNILNEKLPIGLVLVISFTVTILVAVSMYYLTEKPSIKLGKILTTRSKKETSIVSGKTVRRTA